MKGKKTASFHTLFFKISQSSKAILEPGAQSQLSLVFQVYVHPTFTCQVANLIAKCEGAVGSRQSWN